MIEQGTPEWHQLRLGKVTASRVSDVLAKIRSGESASRKNYRAELVVQRLTGMPSESFTNAAMEWGTATEPMARIAYEIAKGVLVEQVGFIDHPTIAMFGCSPDGLVHDGMIEIKCPNSATHIEYLTDNKAPAKYINQMQCQMAVTGRKWCDFVSFDPRLPEDLQLFVVRVERDQKYIDSMEVEVVEFLTEVEGMVNQLKERK
ncbi:MAG: exonuclease [Planctomycetia bacterium]|nr:exonuclease [Planctomycetia bacterium]